LKSKNLGLKQFLFISNTTAFHLSRIDTDLLHAAPGCIRLHTSMVTGFSEFPDSTGFALALLLRDSSTFLKKP